MPEKNSDLKQSGIKEQAGFTLLEVLVALSLAGVVIAIISGAMLQIVHTQQLLSGRGTALMLGQAKLAELEYQAEATSSGEFAKPYQSYKWRAIEEDDGAAIILTVEWRNSYAKHQQIELRSYRYQ